MSGDLNDILAFCPRCFASNENSSWGSPADAQVDYCFNCGSGGVVKLPRWAVKSVREQASWVGKRYYPNEEDIAKAAEREQLLKLVPTFPGRTAERCDDDPKKWKVTQELGDGRTVLTWFTADSEQEALEASRTSQLPYVPAA